MTSFHLNETVCFDQNGLFWYKTMLFRPTQKKKGARRLIVWPLFIIFNILYSKSCLDDYFSNAFNTLSLHQIRQTRHHSQGPTLYYTPTWFLLAGHFCSHHNAALKRLIWSAFIVKSAACDDEFWPIVGNSIG